MLRRFSELPFAFAQVEVLQNRTSHDANPIPVRSRYCADAEDIARRRNLVF
jgi:hypothetical protein